jgi:hypothetical protein
MLDQVDKSVEISLWRCLHDGGLENLSSDLMARTLTLVVDVPFHWEFHQLPSDTRFRVILEGIRLVEALRFEPWPGRRDSPPSTPWKETEKQRQLDYAMGRLESTDWSEFVSQVQAGEGYEILHAALDTQSQSALLLKLEVLSYPNSTFRELRLHAEKLRVFIGPERELNLEEFLKFGNAYWEAFSARDAKHTSST